jgi:hypothetical protein
MSKQILTAVLLLLLAGHTSRAQEEKDWDWVNRHFFNLLEEFMPIEERLGFSLGYRSHHDLHAEELEYSFVFNRILQEKYITVTVRQPESMSLYNQIMALRIKNANESIENIKKQLKVKEQRFSEQTCPAVKTQYEKFYRLSLPMLSARDGIEQARGGFTIVLHPRVHTFKGNISGGSLQLVITEQDHPFVGWAKETREALERCDPGVTKTSKKR